MVKCMLFPDKATYFYYWARTIFLNSRIIVYMWLRAPEKCLLAAISVPWILLLLSTSYMILITMHNQCSIIFPIFIV